MTPEELLRKANEGDMVAQYDLAGHYGKLLKQTENEDEIYKYSLDAMLWLKRSAQQGYGPALEALSELDARPAQTAAKTQEPPAADSEPEADDETVAAVTAAVLESTAEMADVGEVHRSNASSEPEGPETGTGMAEDAAAGHGIFGSGTNLALFIMLIISLLLNALLLAFLFRISRENRSVLPVQTPIPVAEVTPEPTPRPTAKPTPSPEPTPEPTAEPTPSPEPTPEPFWLDLSKYPKLELKPGVDDLYDSYVYYIVTAENTLNMRSGPDTRYERITTIPSLAKVGAVSKYGSWYLVEYEGEMGWVHGNYLTDDLNYRPRNSSSGDLFTN